MSAPFALRPYAAADEDAAVELWRRAWQETYPDIDFAERVQWWRRRWNGELVPRATIVVAEATPDLVGFVTVDRRSGYLDQIVVAPELWGRGVSEALLKEARLVSPRALDLHVNKDNVRAIGFYRKQGFVLAGDDVNPYSGKPVYRMSWRA